MQPRLTLILGTFGIAAALVAAPGGVQINTASLHGTAAFAAGNGHGGGHGHGQGRGGGQGLGASVSASAEASGRSGLAPGHGGTGNGQAAGHDAISGTPSNSARHGASFKGNLNASHASAQAFANAAPNSMVGAIAAAVRESYVSKNDPNAVIDRDEIDDGTLGSALADISNKDVEPEVAGAVADNVAGAIGEPMGP
jgi:hypothetical protein